MGSRWGNRFGLSVCQRSKVTVTYPSYIDIQVDALRKYLQYPYFPMQYNELLHDELHVIVHVHVHVSTRTIL